MIRTAEEPHVPAEVTDWRAFLPEAHRRLEASKALHGGEGTRCEAEGEGEGGEGGDDGAGGAGAVDLENPAIKAAIGKAVERERQAATTREAGLRQNRDTILEEKKRWAKLGTPEEIEAKLADAERIRTEAVAAGVGADPKKFSDAVEKAAQEKFTQEQKRLSGVLEAEKAKVAEHEKTIADLSAQRHRTFVAAELFRAALPDDAKIVHDGAWDYLINTVAPLVVEHEIEGLGTVARLQVNETLVPGSGPDHLMDLRELLSLARQGKGPVPSIGFALVSAGKGSGTTTPKGSQGNPPPGSWWKMTDDQRAAYTTEHGSAKAQALIESSPRA
jgi:hypothetical protein